MNQYLKNLTKIEFVVTYACTGRCKHCSEGSHADHGAHLDPQIAAEAVRKVAAVYDIKTVMTFGGEPLLYPETVYAVMDAARKLNIPRRQVITNGFFSTQPETVRKAAARLAACGVNDLLLSVDAFHQETIPLEAVKRFATEAKRAGIPPRLQPAWLKSPADNNPYNRKTREILADLAPMELAESEGNVVFPEGNAIKYLSEYFTDEIPQNPYRDDPRDIRCLSFEPNGDVLLGNVYERDVMEIIKHYAPKE